MGALVLIRLFRRFVVLFDFEKSPLVYAKGLFFSRKLIAQAMAETIPIISKDNIFQQYSDIEVIW